MSGKDEKAKQIALDFQTNFRQNNYIQEEVIKRAIQFFETDIPSAGSNAAESHQSGLNEFIDIFLPIFIEILEQSPMQYEQNPIQRTRQSILELLNKLLFVRNQQANVRLYALLLSIVRKDNEINAVFATKVFNEFIRLLTEQINNAQAGILQKMNEYGTENLRVAYANLIAKTEEAGRTNSNNTVPTASSTTANSSTDSKIEEFLSYLIDIEKHYPQLESLTDEVYKMICEKSKLFTDISTNNKDPMFNIYKEQNATTKRPQRQSQQQSQQHSSSIHSTPTSARNNSSSSAMPSGSSIVPSGVSLQILSQIPHIFIMIANLDLQPFNKICRAFQQIKAGVSSSVGGSSVNGSSSNPDATATGNANGDSAMEIESTGAAPAVPATAAGGATAASNSQSTSAVTKGSYESFTASLQKHFRDLIGNIIKGFQDVRIQEVYEELGKNATLEMINGLLKMIQFLFVLLKKNTDIQERALFKQIGQGVIESILDIEKIIDCSINMIDRCPEEFFQQRIDTMSKLRSFIQQKNGKLKPRFLQIISNEQKLIGNTQLIGLFGKNQLYNNFLEINKLTILNQGYQHTFSQMFQVNAQKPQEVQQHFSVINAFTESLIKNLFDNNLYIVMQERSLESIKEILKLFNFKISANQTTPKELKTFRHNILMNLLQAIQLKYKEISRNFSSINKFIEGQPPLTPAVNSSTDQPPPLQKLHLNQMPIVSIPDYKDMEWKKKRIDFIEKNNIDIDVNLQSTQAMQMVQLEIYNEKETLCLNGIMIKRGIDRQYIRDVKMKIIFQLIELQKDIQTYLFKENREDEYNLFISKYKTVSNAQMQQKQRILSSMNILREDQRTIMRRILKSGLEIFEVFHDYEHTTIKGPDLTGVQPSQRKNHFVLFMENFNQINDKVSFKDIFEPNIDVIFKYLLKYIDCSEQCMRNFIVEPFIATPEKISQMPNMALENPYLAQILTTYLMHKLNTNVETIDPFSPFYEYKDKFFTHAQQIFKLPLRSLLRLQDHEFVLTYFRQIILFLIKKAHNSQYPLEYLTILRTLLRSVFAQNNEQSQIGNTLMTQFYTICHKTDEVTPPLPPSQQMDQRYTNINILENLVAMFDTDILEVKIIVCELIHMLPLRIKHIVSKTKLLGRPIVKSLSLMDSSQTMRTLKTIDNIFGYSSQDEIQVFFADVKDELIEKLYEILYEQRLVDEIRKKPQLFSENHIVMLSKKIQNDPVTIVVKLLGRMNQLTRQNKLTEKLSQEIKTYEVLEQFAIHITMGNHGSSEPHELKLPLNDIIMHCLEIFNKMIDNFYCQTARGNAAQSAFCILKIALFQFFPDSLFQDGSDSIIPEEVASQQQRSASRQLFQKIVNHESESDASSTETLFDKILRMFFEIVGFDQKLTQTYSVVNRFKKEASNILEVLSKTLCSLCASGSVEARKYLEALTLNGIRSVKMKVILTREELHLNKDHVCGQIEFIQKLFKKQQEILTSETDKDFLVSYQGFYLRSILKELLNTTNQNKIYGLQVILLDFIDEYVKDATLLSNDQANLIEIANAVFVVLNELPDILNLKTAKVSQQIIAKVVKFFRKHRESFERMSIKKLLTIFFNNLLTYRENAHLLAKECIINLSQILKRSLIELFNWRFDSPNEDNPQEIQGEVPMNKIIENNGSSTYLGVLLQKIMSAIQNFSLNNGNFENLKSMKYLANAYRSLEFILCCDTPRLPFRVLVNEPPTREELLSGNQQAGGASNVGGNFPEKFYKFDSDIVTIIQSSDIIITSNTDKMSKHVKIIIENTRPIQSNAANVSSTSANAGGASSANNNTSNASNSASSNAQNVSQPSRIPPNTAPSGSNATAPATPGDSNAIPAIPPSQIPPRSSSSTQPSQQGSSSSQQQQQQGQQGGAAQRPGGSSMSSIQNTFQINNQVYLNIQEFDLNIEDVDLRMKEQSLLIQSILSFLKSLLLLNQVKQVTKSNLKNREKQQHDSSEVLNYRYKIILKLFNQMTRIERGISEVSRDCLHEIINQDQHPKELLNNEDKLKSILKPVLMCLSNSFTTFTPSFLQVLKKILKLLTPCFNKALSDKLTTHLTDVTADFNIRYDFDCISGLLKLFQYLQYAYTTAFTNMPVRQKEYIKKQIDGIISNVNKIEQAYSQTDGKYHIQNATRKSLCKFMNSMATQVVDNYFTETDPDIVNLLLEVLKLPKAMILRERLTRDTNQSVILKLYSKEKENSLSFLKMIKMLGRNNCRLMLNNQQGIDMIKERFTETIKIQRDKSITEGTQNLSSSVNTKCKIVYYLKILILYCQQKHSDIDTLFNLADFLSIRLPRYTFFVQDFFRSYLPYHYTPEEKKAIFDRFMEFTQYNIDRKEVKIETIINISYHIIYPMLVHSHKLGQSLQIVNKHKYVDFFSQFTVPKLMFPYYRLDIEILQLSTLLLSFLQTEIVQLKKQFVQFGWKYMKIEDKIMKNFGYIYTSQFIRLFGIPDDMIINIYVALINKRTDDTTSTSNSSQQQQQESDINSLSKKALNFLIPHFDTCSASLKTEWIKWTLQSLNDEQNQKNQMNTLKFWQIFIENHKFFYTYRKEFRTMMVNTMQQMIVHPSRPNSNSNQNRLAWDLSFLSIEWIFIELKEILKTGSTHAVTLKIKELIVQQQKLQQQEQEKIEAEEGGAPAEILGTEQDANNNNNNNNNNVMQSQDVVIEQEKLEIEVERDANQRPRSNSANDSNLPSSTNINSQDTNNTNSNTNNTNSSSSTNSQTVELSAEQQAQLAEHGIKLSKVNITEEDLLNAKQNLIEQFCAENDQGVQHVIIPFFLKLMQNVLQSQPADREENAFIKRLMYLVKKLFFIWPNNNLKPEYYKKELAKLTITKHYLQQLNFLSIMLEFESNEKALSFLPIVQKLFEYNKQQSQPPSMPGAPGLSTANSQQNSQNESQQAAGGPSMIHQQSGQQQSSMQHQQSSQQQQAQQQSLLQIEHSYIVLVLSKIIKKMLTVSSMYKENEQGQEFTRMVTLQVKESIEQHVKYIHTSTQRQNQQNPITQAQIQSIKLSQPMSISLAIKLTKTLYSLDDKIDLGLRNIKTLMTYQLEKVKLLKTSQDGYFVIGQDKNADYNSELASKIIKTDIRSSQPNRGVIQEYDDEFEETLIYQEELFDNPKIQMIHSKQNYITLMRTLALKINHFNDRENQDIANVIRMLASNLEKVPDLDIRIESVNLLKCLFIGEKAFKGGVIPPQYAKIKLLTLSPEKKMDLIQQQQMFSYIARIFDKKFGQTNLPLRITSSSPDYAAETLSLKIGEENIAKEFMNLLISIIKECGINKIESNLIRYLLLLFVKNSSSKELALFFEMAGDLFCTSDFNCLQMMFGQFQNERCFKRISQIVINPNLKDQVSLENLEQDEVLLLGFKLILFRIIDCAADVKIRFTSPNFESNSIGSTDESASSSISTATREKYADYFSLRKFSLNKREIIDLYGEMMTSAQLKQSPITQNPMQANDPMNSTIYILNKSQAAYNCPIVPHLLIPAFKNVFNFMVQLNPKPIEFRQQAMCLFEQSILRLNNFPQFFMMGLQQHKQYISMYLGQTLTELLIDELNVPTGYLIYPEKLQAACREYSIWSYVQLYLERMHFQREKTIDQYKQFPLKNFETSSALDQLSHILDEINENDLSYGLKYYMSTSPSLKRAIAISQQREWVDAQHYLIENSSQIFENQAKFTKENAPYYALLEDYQSLMDQSIYKNLFIETQKNLGRWDELSNYSEQNHHILMYLECLYNTSNFLTLKKQFQRCSDIGINCENAFKYHCLGLIEFHRTPDETSQQESAKNLQLAYYQTLKDWTKFPKTYTAIHLKHSQQLQMLIELEEGYRVRDSRDQVPDNHQLPPLSIEQLSKSALNMINQWRERMPHKFENLVAWKNVVDQRNFIMVSIHNRLRDRFKNFLHKVQQVCAQRRAQQAQGGDQSSSGQPGSINSNNSTGGSSNAPGSAANPTGAGLSSNAGPNSNSGTNQSSTAQPEMIVQKYLDPERLEKLIAPFTDQRWNTLKYLKIQKQFGQTTIDKMPNIDARLHPEEQYLRAKLIASIYKENESVNNLKHAIETIEKIPSKDQEEFRHHKADLLRKRALLNWQNEKYLEATEDMQKSLVVCETYYKTWKSWLDICFQSYLKRKNSEYWARNAMQLIPQALKYKSYKSQLIMSYAFFIMHTDPQFFIENLKQILQELPKPQLLLWVPYLLSMIQNSPAGTNADIVDNFVRILNELSAIYPQHIFYYLRGFLDLSPQQLAMNNQSILSIYQGMRIGQNSALVRMMEIFSDSVSKLHYSTDAAFEFELALCDANSLIEDFASLRPSDPIQPLYLRTVEIIQQLSAYSFFRENIMTVQEAAEFTELLRHQTAAPPVQKVIAILRQKIYTPLLRMFIKNYINQVNPTTQIPSEQLLALSQNVQEIELPGQYRIPPNSPAFKDFDPITHTTILSLNQSLHVSFKGRKVVRSIAINASNNKQYLYEIHDMGQQQGNKGSFQRNSIRLNATQQLQDIMNIMFSLSKETSIRSIAIKQPTHFALSMLNNARFSSTYRGPLQILLVPTTHNTETLQDIYDKCVLKQQNQEQLNANVTDIFNLHLDQFEVNNLQGINKHMKSIISDTMLQDYVHSKVRDLSDYLYIRKEIASTYSSAMFFNYFLGKTLKLSDIHLDFERGVAFTQATNIEFSAKDQTKLLVKNPHSIRLSRNISTYIGEIAKLGIIAPNFISMAKAITMPKLAMKEISGLFLNEMLIANGINEQLSSETFREEHKKLYDKVLWMYVEDLSNTLSKAAAATSNNSGNAMEQEESKEGNTNGQSQQNNASNNHNSNNEANGAVNNNSSNQATPQKQSNYQSKTNYGFVEPLYPRAHSIIETIQQNQLHNSNALHHKYWF